MTKKKEAGNNAPGSMTAAFQGREAVAHVGLGPACQVGPMV